MASTIRWKFVIVTGILAMIVSLTSGGLAGIRFGLLLFRALIGGLVFAVLAVALNLLVARVFPDFLEKESSAGNEEEPPGSLVDIVMPEEQPSVTPDSAEAAEMENGAAAPVGGFDGDKNPLPRTGMDEGAEQIDTLPPDVLEDDREPEEMAQAIQTVLKRDEEG